MKKIQIEIISSPNIETVNNRIAELLEQSNRWEFSDLRITPYSTCQQVEFTIVAQRESFEISPVKPEATADNSNGGGARDH